MIKVKKCCCCIELTTGGQILGWIGVFTALIYMLFCGAFIVSYEYWIQQLKEIGHEDESNILQTYKIAIMFILVVLIISSVINLLCCVLLIRGVMTRKPDLILPWLIIQALAIILQILGSFGKVQDVDAFLLTFMGLALEMYFFICVYSLYNILKTPEFQGVIYAPPPICPPPYKV